MYARRSFRIEGERHHNPGAIHLWLSFSSRSLIHFSFDASRPPTRCHSPSIDGCIPADPLIRNSSSEAAESSPFPAIQPLPPSYDIVADYSSLSLCAQLSEPFLLIASVPASTATTLLCKWGAVLTLFSPDCFAASLLLVVHAKPPT